MRYVRENVLSLVPRGGGGLRSAAYRLQFIIVSPDIDREKTAAAGRASFFLRVLIYRYYRYYHYFLAGGPSRGCRLLLARGRCSGLSPYRHGGGNLPRGVRPTRVHLEHGNLVLFPSFCVRRVFAV